MKPEPNVLIVDDVEANVVALVALLESLPCKLVTARSGNEALGQLLKRDYAVMLLDVQMPDMDGYEVAKWVRENEATRDVPIIFLTAMIESEENMLRGYGTGAVDVLFKPFNPHVLRSKVQIFLDLYMSRQSLAKEIEAHKATLAQLEAFNYTVSHDLRAPLRPLDGFSQILIEEYGHALDDKGRNYLERIQRAARRMSQLIDDMMRLASIGRMDLRRSPVDIGALARSIVAELRANDPTREVEVDVTDATDEADEQLVRIALENLLRNAWKFTRNKARCRIEVGKQVEGRETVYRVRDDGAGFDPAHARRMFQPFQRFHNAEDFEGTGVGLATVARIVRLHGGRIWAESSPGSGATFFFTLHPIPS